MEINNKRREWAASSVNYITGCGNNCLYCFSRAMAIRSGRKTSDNWHIEDVREKDLIKKRKKVEGRIMFPSSHDLTPMHLSSSIELLKKLLVTGNDVLVVSKPHLTCITEICKECMPYKSQILIRFTIGSANNSVLKLWEPNAPAFEERLACLKYAFEQGYETSVSSEPMLDNNISAVIDATLPYISDAIWLGKMNNLRQNLYLSGISNSSIWKEAEKLADLQNDAAIKALYGQYKDNEKIKWKSSIKSVVGIPLADSAGADM
jgi:DNA repair photolyase